MSEPERPRQLYHTHRLHLGPDPGLNPFQRQTEPGRQPVRIVLFTPDNNWLLSGGFLKIFNSNDGSLIYSSAEKGMEFATDLILDACISGDGRYLAMVKAGRMEIFDLAARSVTGRVRSLNIYDVAIGPDNRTLVYVLSTGVVVTSP
ncbi:MAG TPA: hypothetical protein VMW76_05595 [Bacteroidales bacterium]|nr:hypothetical protein [Bacteroidales bacterium]